VIKKTAPDSDPAIRVVAVIGAGKAGRSFAMACASAGFYVVLEDVMPSNLRAAEMEYSDLSLRGGYGEFELASTVEGAVREADIAIDFVPDELESKLEIFSMADRMAPPKTILCTPSVALSITDLASCVYRPDRCLAIRGDLFAGGSVQILFPPSIKPSVLTSVEAFFTRLGVSSVSTADPESAALTKNIA
jgi:3-hydroxybutyryl-CoA dehydrogenase